MYMDEPNGGQELEPMPASLSFVLTLTALATILLGVVPTPVLKLAQLSALSLP